MKETSNHYNKRNIPKKSGINANGIHHNEFLKEHYEFLTSRFNNCHGCNCQSINRYATNSFFYYLKIFMAWHAQPTNLSNTFFGCHFVHCDIERRVYVLHRSTIHTIRVQKVSQNFILSEN